MKRIAIAFVIAVLTASLCSQNCLALEQYPVGIAGRLTAIDGSVIPGVEVRAFNQQTKRITTVKTSATGEYWMELGPGTYDVSVVSEPWKTEKRKDIKVEGGKCFVDFVLTLRPPIMD